jgi:hypothetical protein
MVHFVFFFQLIMTHLNTFWQEAHRQRLGLVICTECNCVFLAQSLSQKLSFYVNSYRNVLKVDPMQPKRIKSLALFLRLTKKYISCLLDVAGRSSFCQVVEVDGIVGKEGLHDGYGVHGNMEVGVTGTRGKDKLWCVGIRDSREIL